MSEALGSFDAIVVGARVAGSAAAIMLGRQRRKVLLLDRAKFPSDAISTHIVLPGGAKVLARLGALDELDRLGAHHFARQRTRAPEVDFTGVPRDRSGAVSEGICLGRLKMDAAMLEMARSTDSVEVREQFRVVDLLVDGGAVVGVRGEDRSGLHQFRAPLVIGADGMRSTVARLAAGLSGAFPRTEIFCARAYYYGYFAGVRADRLNGTVMLEFDAHPGDFHIACRCEDGLTVVGVGFDAAELDDFRHDLSGNFHRKIADSAEFGALVEGATLASRIFSVGNLQNTCRTPVCDGALLLGDAGLHVDPILGQGHAFALLSAEMMAEMAPGWFAAPRGAWIGADVMAEFTARREAELMPHYNVAVTYSRSLTPDPMLTMVQRAAASEQWAADEMASFASLVLPPGSFPSLSFGRLIARQQQLAG